MGSLAIGEERQKLLPLHARPMAHAADVKVNERRARARVVADTAALHAQGSLAQSRKLDARNEKIDGLAECVLAVFRHTLAAAAQHRICRRRTVGGNDVDVVPSTDRPVDLPKQIEHTRIHFG